MERKIMLSVFLFIFIACKDKNEYYLINPKNERDYYKIEMSEDNSKMKIQSIFNEKDKGTLYYINVNGEFHECDGDYSEESIDKEVFMSTKKEYKYSSPNRIFSRPDKIIKKERNFYVTMWETSDSAHPVYYKYYYDTDYKIVKKETPWQIYLFKESR